MEINLLPPKPLIERIFWPALSLLILMLAALGFLLMHLHVSKTEHLAELEHEIQVYQEQQKQIQETSHWNQQVQKKEEELKQIRRYLAFTEGLEANLNPDWSVVLQRLITSLPAQSEVVEIRASANELIGIIAFSNLKDIARLIDVLEHAPEIGKVKMNLVDHPDSSLDISEPYIQQLFNQQLTYIAEIALYAGDIHL